MEAPSLQYRELVCYTGGPPQGRFYQKVCLICRYGEAQHWARDDAHGTWNSAEAVLSIGEADGQPKQQGSHDSSTTQAPVEADIDEVCPLFSAMWGLSMDAWPAENMHGCHVRGCCSVFQAVPF